jgi:peptidoglycan/LPS O-acetylase OafA/YrhL
MSAPDTRASPSALRRFFALDPLDNRYPALHGVRFLAILSVVQYHVTGVFGPLPGLRIDGDFAEMSTRVFFGMDLFFILSGFLIGSILLRSLEQEGTQNIRRFYLRRIFRTFPSYYIVLTVLALTMSLTAAQRAQLPFEYAYLTNFTTLKHLDVVMLWGWSLSLEEQFYLTVPLLFFVLHRLRSDRARLLLLVALWSLGLVIRLAIYRSERTWTDFDFSQALYYRTYTRFDTILCGVLLAFVETRYGAAIGRWLTHPLHRALLALPALACLWLLLRPTMFGDSHVQLTRVFLWGTVTSLMYFAALLLLLHADGPLVRFLSAPIFRSLATVGYGVYLVHIPILRLLVPTAQKLTASGVSMALVWPGALVVVMVLALATGYVMHLLIEKPSLWVRQKLAG